ncbi:hypothetical protein RIF29_22908 [Crotalaria pallida]|uniref:Uncharacterized protein n=1 Tax=Crotalaria pallida TaxID=3830 RepID=A0AAN9I762_CROPI
MKMDAEKKVVGKKRKWDEPLDNQNKIQGREEGTQCSETVNECNLDEPMPILTLSARYANTSPPPTDESALSDIPPIFEPQLLMIQPHTQRDIAANLQHQLPPNIQPPHADDEPPHFH